MEISYFHVLLIVCVMMIKLIMILLCAFEVLQCTH